MASVSRRARVPRRRPARAGRLDRAQVEKLEDLRLVDRLLQRLAVDHRGEVEQGAGDGRAGDPVDHGDLGRDRMADVDADSIELPTRLRRDHDVDESTRTAPDLGECAGGLMREGRVAAAGEDRGHPMRFRGRDSVSDCVDPAAYWVKPTSRDPASDTAGREPEFPQLPERHSPVLVVRELGYRAVGEMCRSFRPAWGRFEHLGGHGGRVAVETSPLRAPLCRKVRSGVASPLWGSA